MNARRACATLLVPAVCCTIPIVADAQLEEILVTATRRETNLQDTPLSIQAFTAEQLELGGITNGRDLGIMVPNVVLNPNTGGAQPNFYIRGLPGVGLYVDGVWQDGFGFQQMDFAEMERVEVLRGPQGTLFGRNTNAGAVNMTTRKPADDFGARVKLGVGDFNRRDVQLSVDLPITDTLKTKFTGATFENDGFLKGLTTPWDFGAQDDTILRADFLWEPLDKLSLRFTYNDESKKGTDPRIHRMTRYDNSKVYAYNIMLGAFQQQANAACLANVPACIALNNQFGSPGSAAGWARPPPGVGTRYTGSASPAFNPTTHTTDYSGGVSSNYRTSLVPNQVFGPGEVGKWETKSDSMEDGITADLQYSTLNLKWGITDRLNFEAILSQWNQDQRQVIDFDGTEFLITTDDIPQVRENKTIELHLSGSTPNGRINWLAGYYRLKEDLTERFYRWGMWEFVIPNTAPGVAPTVNTVAAEYVRQTATLLGLNGVNNAPPGQPVVNSGGNMLTPNAAPVLFAPAGRYPWNFGFISADTLRNAFDDDEAWFGEATFGLTKKLDLTIGARLSDKTGGDITMTPTDAFRTPDPSIRPQGDPFAGFATSVYNDADQPTIDTYKASVAYHPTDAMMIYGTYSEGFTSANEPLVTIGATAVVPNGCGVRLTPTQVRCSVPAELIDNKEVGLRSEWLDGKLRFNATYFDSHWTGMRVWLLPRDAAGNTQPFPYQSGDGEGTASGFEFEVVYGATDRLQLNFGLGLIDTNYIQSGFFDGTTGQFPGAPFAYAADQSGTVGATYEIPLKNSGRFLVVGNYGYMGDYARDSAYQRTLIDANGNPILEPGYGILNARLVYEPAARNYSVEVWGKNLTDELYVNGGFDTRDTWGYDFSIVGRSREVGLSLTFNF
ncbi:MAG TPA: TonB-dependent receptor [Gammaproteobacteria bacterium]|nr:TonB-dependent receptor [Gammaproteobacteria bacterium]